MHPYIFIENGDISHRVRGVGGHGGRVMRKERRQAQSKERYMMNWMMIGNRLKL